MLLTLYDLLVPDSQDPIYVQDKNLCEYQIQLINHTYIYMYIYILLTIKLGIAMIIGTNFVLNFLFSRQIKEFFALREKNNI